MYDHKLRVFCTVAETNSFSKASEIVNRTQPAVSLQIQALEDEYGIKLFDRSNNTVVMTEAGSHFYKYAKEILSLYSDLEKRMGEITNSARGNPSIGASSTIGNYLLPSVIVAINKRYPRIKVNLQVGNTRMVINLLDSGNIDIGLVEGEVQRQKIEVEKLLSDELVLIMPPSHPWAKRKDVSISKLITEPFIIREEGSGTRQMIEKVLQKKNLSLQGFKKTFVLGSTEAIKAAVADGMGLAVVSAWAARKEVRYGILKTITFNDIRFLRDFYLICRKGNILRREDNRHALEQILGFLKTYPFEDPLSF